MNKKLLEVVEGYRQDIIDSAVEIIKIKSVEDEPAEGAPFGPGVGEALDYALNLGKSLGFESVNLDGYAGYCEFGDGDETVGVLVHLDVVPEGSDWTYEPYGGEIADGRIYGRGAIDNKGPAIASMYALKALKDTNVEMNRKVRIIFGTNEETNWKDMEHYFSVEKAPDMGFTPDADFPVIQGEKGISIFDLKLGLESDDRVEIVDISGGNRPNMVPDFCEIKVVIKDGSLKKDFIDSLSSSGLEVEDSEVTILKSYGVSAHGSLPEKGENAVTAMFKAIDGALNGQTTLGAFAKLYLDKIGSGYDGAGLDCDFEDEISGKLVFNMGTISYEESSITLGINIRYPIESSIDEIYGAIKSALPEASLLEREHKAPIYMDMENELVQKLLGAYRDLTGDMEAQPIVIGGGTYARASNNILAFGPHYPGQESTAHKKDEHIEIEQLIEISKIYAETLYRLVK